MLAGDLIAGKYRLVRWIGDGSVGTVWAAINERTGRQIALKLIQSPSPEIRRRLLAEARACGRIEHRNVIEILDVDTTEQGEPFLVMPLLSGETLAARLERDRRLRPEQAVRVAVDVARALRVAHAAGIVHRDLKPANIFLHREIDADEEQVKVLDFGVSKLLVEADATSTATGSLMGSPAYMSPEQARGSKGIDHRSDLWSLGVVLFESIAGERPFPSRSAYGVVAEILTSPIPSIADLVHGLDPRLDAVVARCLERDVAQRVASAGELLELLQPLTSDRRASSRDAPIPDDRAPTAIFERSNRPPEAAPSHTAQLDSPARTAPFPSFKETMRLPPDGVESTVLGMPPALPLQTITVPLGDPQAISTPDERPIPAPLGASQPSAPGPVETFSATPLVRPYSSSSTARQQAGHGKTRMVLFAALGALASIALVAGAIRATSNEAPSPAQSPSSEHASAITSPTPTASAPEEPASSMRPPIRIDDLPEIAPPAPRPQPTSRPFPRAESSQQATALSSTLHINSIPISNVILDGKPLGSTPKVGVSVAPGPHTVVFILPEQGSRTFNIQVEAGQTKTVAVRFQ